MNTKNQLYRIVLLCLCLMVFAGHAAAQLGFQEGFYHAISRHKRQLVRHGGNLHKINFRKDFRKEVARQHAYDARHSLGEEKMKLAQWKEEGNRAGVTVSYVRRMSEYVGEPAGHHATSEHTLRTDRPRHTLFSIHTHHQQVIKRKNMPSSNESPLP